MEDIISVYQQPYQAEFPVICMDEKPVQLLADTRLPIPMKPGTIKKFDNEYIRQGTCSIFLFTEPLSGWRRAEVSTRRTRIDWAKQLRILLEVDYPDAEKIILVMDNLNTHHICAFYEAFPPEKAFEYAQRLEIHYTPKHGSWLNIAETELSVLGSQALRQRVPTQTELAEIVHAWAAKRNQQQRGVDWQFTASDARIRLKRLYPQSIDDVKG